MGRFRRNNDDNDNKDDKPRSNRFGRRASGDGGDDKKDDKSSGRRSPFGSSSKEEGSSPFNRRSGGDSGGSSSGSRSSRFSRSSGGDDKKDDKKSGSGSSRFGRRSSSGSSSGSSGSGSSRFGRRASSGGDDKKDDKKSGSGSSRFSRQSGGKDSSSSSSSGGRSSSRFSRSSGGDDKKDDKKSGSGSSRFGRRSGGDDKKDDKKSGSGSSRFNRRSGGNDSSSSSSRRGSSSTSSGGSSGGRTFGSSGSGGSKRTSGSDSGGGRTFGSRGSSSGSDKKSDSSSSGGRTFGSSGSKRSSGSSTSSSSSGGRSSSRFGGGAKSDDKKDNKKSSGGSSRFSRGKSGAKDNKKDEKSGGGGFLSRFRGGSDDSKDDKKAKPRGSAAKKDDSSGGIGGFFNRFRGGGDDSDSKKSSAKGKKGSDKKALPKQKGTARNVTTGLDLDRKLDILGFVMIAVGVLMFFGWLQTTLSTTDTGAGGLTASIDNIMAQLFGLGRIIIPVVLAYIGGWLVLRYFGTMFDIDYWRIAGFILIFFGLLTTIQWWDLMFLEFPDRVNYAPDMETLNIQSDQLWQDGGGGGIIGHLTYMTLQRNLGDIVVPVFLVIWWIAGVYFAFELTLERISNYVIATRAARAAKRAERDAQRIKEESEKVPEPAKQPATQPALAMAGAGSSGGSATVAPDQPKEEAKPKRQGLIGRLFGRTSAPTDAPITADTDIDPKRATSAKADGRTAAPSDAPITADTDSDQPKRRGLGLRRGRKEQPKQVDGKTETEKGDEDEKTGIQPRRRRFGSLTGRGSDDAATEDAAKEKASPAGRRKTPADTPAAASTDQQAEKPAQPARRGTADSQPSGRRTAPPTPAAVAKDDSSQEKAAEPAKASGTSATTKPNDDKAVKSDDKSKETAKDGDGLKTAAAAATTAAASTAIAAGKSSDDKADDKPAKKSPFDRTAKTEDKPAEPAKAEEAKSDDKAAEPEAATTAKPRGIFNRDTKQETPNAQSKPVPKPAAKTEETTEEKPETEPEKPTAAAVAEEQGMSESAVAAVQMATANQPEPSSNGGGNAKSKSEQAEDELKQAEEEAKSGRWRHPDYLKLLEEGSEQIIEQQILLQRSKVIEDTLDSFGAPGKVVEVNTGPVITQFGVEPDYIERRNGSKARVKVSAIANLEKDVALALAAKSIRIEAPVPGKGYVGIEVPNAEASVVSLRDVMMSPEHQKKVKKSQLSIGLGRRVDGQPVSADLTQMPHLLIAGATGSGKSVCVNAIIAGLLLQNTPEELQFIMVDPKRVELTGYNGIPHLVSPVVTELERIVGVLKWVQREMDDRYRRFADVGARNIIDFNDNKRPEGVEKLPYLVVIVDELADLMMLAPDETERLIARLAQMARATGIHLIISTQRPSVDVVTGLIKANFPARIAFAVASSVDSRVILDQPGAEKLLGRGDMLFQAPDAPAPTRMQGAFLSDSEINRITHYWKSIQAIKEKTGKKKPGMNITEGQNVPSVSSRSQRFSGGTSGSSSSRRMPSNQQQRFYENQSSGGNGSSNNDEDDLLGRAVELVRNQNKASIAMLQRNFRIGFDRANRLMELLEEKEVVGPSEEGSSLREVLPPKEEK